MKCILMLLVSIFVLVGVAFFTLFERKLLGYIQLRSGPNKVGFTGILQPFADAIKLFSKEHVAPDYSNYLAYLLSPVFSLGLALVGWCVVPSTFNLFSFESSILFFLCVMGLGVYGLLASGWSSNSKYALLGALRGVAQTISYEVSMVLILLGPIMVSLTFSWLDFLKFQYDFVFVLVMPWGAMIFFISSLAETNRTPFDFAEGESELVSGYNIEYGSGGFALLMLAEYASILFMSMIFVVLFLGLRLNLSGFMMFLFLGFLFVWVRGTLPRFRYDKLMFLTWSVFLPYSLFYLVLSGSFLGLYG